MKQNSCVYVFSPDTLFSGSNIFLPAFSKNDSNLFYSTLFLNHYEVLLKVQSDFDIYFILNEKDRSNLPQEMNQIKEKSLFFNITDINFFFKELNEKYFINYLNNLILYTNTIGITPPDIKKAIDFLAIDDETIVLGKSATDKIIFFGFNTFNPAITEGLDSSAKDFSRLLLKVCKEDNYLQVFGDFLSIDSPDDFKKLYSELSKKESINYCSTTMHERFTHLFVEYKDLLK